MMNSVRFKKLIVSQSRFIFKSNLSPGFSSAASSPQTNTTSGYATDSQDFLEEFSIYDPMDIREVNHKYMPSCSYEPLIFNEEALNVEDIWLEFCLCVCFSIYKIIF